VFHSSGANILYPDCPCDSANHPFEQEGELSPESVTPVRLQVPNVLNLVEILVKTKLTVRVTTPSSCFSQNLTYLQHLRPFRFEMKLRIQVSVKNLSSREGAKNAKVNQHYFLT